MLPRAAGSLYPSDDRPSDKYVHAGWNAYAKTQKTQTAYTALPQSTRSQAVT